MSIRNQIRQVYRSAIRFVKQRLPRQQPPKLKRVLPNLYLQGTGLEIGALHNPQWTPCGVRVRYLDRIPNDELTSQYPDLKQKSLVPLDYVDNGETLQRVETGTHDFVIANHFLEHCQDPIGTLKQIFRVLKPTGVAYLSIPDKRYTFDRERPLTTLAHLWQDHRSGPESGRRGHFEEYVKFVHQVDDSAEIKRQADVLIAQDFSIHYHVWTQHEILELLLSLQNELQFEIESFCKNKHEAICILRKQATEQTSVARPVGFQDYSNKAA